MAKKKIENEIVIENISDESLDNLMSDRYAIYAKYVIQDRAVPDVRDGLKPVQRRIIYAMWEANNVYNKPHKKCARIVGDVMGQFHPHGDTSIYDALTRMSQSWKMSIPLIDFHGNNGSMDNDPAAAYRYTEARMSEFANNLLFNIQKNTVDMTLNYDDKKLEPTVLPSIIPNLYVNGAEGIAIAIATNIPPHNLNEMCEAVIYRINNPRCDLSELLNIVKGPDFPTGGSIYKGQGIEDIYSTGKGRVEIVSKVDTVEEKDYNKLVVSEIPFGVNKKDLVYSIDKIKKENDVDGIVEVKDLSEGESVNIEITLKKEADPKVILQYLLNKTQLKVPYSANIVAICNKHPRTLTLTTYLDIFIEFQVDIRIRTFKFDLDKASKRLHIVAGLIKALSVIDEIIKIIRNSKNKGDAKQNLINAFEFSDVQAEAIVTMPLYKLTTTDVQTYIDEKNDLEKEINQINDYLNNPKKINKIIINDLKEIIKKYPTPRKTQVIEQSDEIVIDKRDLIAKENVYCVITKDGYVKRSSIKSVKASNFALPGLKDGDAIVMNTLVSTMDYILAFTNKGNYLCIPVHEIIEGKWKDEGKHINYMCNLPFDENIIKCIVVSTFDKNVYIGLITKGGLIKRTPLSNFYQQRFSKPIKCIIFSSKDDELQDVSVLNGVSNLFIVTKTGILTFYNENQFDPTGLKSSGVKAISQSKSKKNDIDKREIQSLISFRKDEKNKIIVITDKGMCRIFDPSKFDLTDRLGRLDRLFDQYKSNIHNIVYIGKIVDKNKPMTINATLSDGTIFTTTIDDYRLSDLKNPKKNLDFDDKLTIKDVFIEDVQRINENTKEEGNIFNTNSFNDNNSDKTDGETNKDLKITDNQKENNSIIDKLNNLETKKKTRKKKIIIDDSKKDDDIEYEQVSIFDYLGD